MSWRGFFGHWTQADIERHNARAAGTIQAHEAKAEGVKRELDLHGHISNFCRSMGWIYFHGNPSVRSRRTRGEPDFLCLLPGGKVLFVECKSEEGKLSIDQNSMNAHMVKLGHKMHIVRSISEFSALIEKVLNSDDQTSQNL